jgi:hypothetical protein
MSYVVCGWVKQRVCGRWANVDMPEKPHYGCQLSSYTVKSNVLTYIDSPFSLQLVQSVL